MTDTSNITLDILKIIRNQLADQGRRMDDGFQNMNLQFAALNERLSGQLISEIELREEMKQLQDRLRRVEQRLEITE